MANNKLLYRAMALFVSFLPHYIGAKTIIYDYNGVLSKINRIGMAKEIGLADTLFYYLLDVKNAQEIESRLLYTLEQIGGKQQAQIKVCGANQEPLPELMCRWMDGRFDAKAEKKGIFDALCKLKKAGFFKNNREYRVIKNTIRIMFLSQTA